MGEINSEYVASLKSIETENKIKKLELRIARLESEKYNNYQEPDTSLYMI